MDEFIVIWCLEEPTRFRCIQIHIEMIYKKKKTYVILHSSSGSRIHLLINYTKKED